MLSDGTAVRLGGPVLKDVASLSLAKLFVGSEGTLGIVTEVTLRLLPAPPTPSTLVATFASTADAVEAILAIMSSLRPAMLEFMDNAAINAVKDLLHMGLDRDAAALVVARSDSREQDAEREIAAMSEACVRNGAVDVLSTTDQADGEAFLVARRMAIPAVEGRGKLLLEDVGVPLPRLRELVVGVEAIAAQPERAIAMIAHAGDGNTHPLIVFPPSDAELTAHAEQAFGEIMDLAIGLGGTITGEHGVGRLKKD